MIEKLYNIRTLFIKSKMESLPFYTLYLLYIIVLLGIVRTFVNIKNNNKEHIVKEHIILGETTYVTTNIGNQTIFLNDAKITPENGAYHVLTVVLFLFSVIFTICLMIVIFKIIKFKTLMYIYNKIIDNIYLKYDNDKYFLIVNYTLNKKYYESEIPCDKFMDSYTISGSIDFKVHEKILYKLIKHKINNFAKK